MFTINPDWKDITPELLMNEHGIRTQSWGDHLDLLSRVFNLKLKEMLQELRRDNVFGRHVASVYTFKFQNRGLLYLSSESQFSRRLTRWSPLKSSGC
jgi:Helitron helicase-like domain at N-terminus